MSQDQNDKNRARQLLASFAGAAIGGGLMGYGADIAQDPLMSTYVGALVSSGMAVCAAAVTKLTQSVRDDMQNAEQEPAPAVPEI